MPSGQLTVIGIGHIVERRRRSRLDSAYLHYWAWAPAMPQHAAVIAVVLLERPTCRDCVASKSRLRATDVDRYLEIIASALLVLRLEDERCRVCGIAGPVFCVRRSSDVIRPPGSIDDRADDDLRPKARLLANTHEIPTIRVSENTEGKPCSLLCGRQTAHGSAWYEVRFSTRSFWLDYECFAIWQQEMERARQHP